MIILSNTQRLRYLYALLHDSKYVYVRGVVTDTIKILVFKCVNYTPLVYKNKECCSYLSTVPKAAVNSTFFGFQFKTCKKLINISHKIKYSDCQIETDI